MSLGEVEEQDDSCGPNLPCIKSVYTSCQLEIQLNDACSAAMLAVIIISVVCINFIIITG